MKEKKELFMLLYKPVHESFERFCKARAYGHMPFRDLMQDTLAIAFSKFEQLKQNEKFLYYLFGIATRLLANQRRKISTVYQNEIPESIHFLHAEAERKSEIDHLYKALSFLPTDQRDALIYFEIVGFSVKEIAFFQKKSEVAIRQQLSRGRQKLLVLLQEKKEYKNIMP
jgi:RNA polymerase sigma-70 factor (ECF subfamily)